MSVGPVVGRARVQTNMSWDSSDLDKIGDRIRNQLSKIGERNGQIYRNFGRDAVVSWRLALGAIVTSAPWMGAAISAVSGTVTMLAGSLYSLAQSSFGLYPVLGSLGVAVGTLRIGMTHFMDAVKATKPEDLAMYLDMLTPSAGAAAIAVRGLSGAATRLRESVQERMFTGLAAEIEKLSTTLFPVLTKNLTDMAGVWNRLITEMLGYVNSAAGLKTINKVLEGSTSIFDKLSGAVIPFLDGAMKLFVALTPAGERLATRIADVAKSFQSWTSAEGFGNRIDAMMQRAETTAGLLLKVVGNLGGALANVFKGANGETNNFLQMLIDLTQRFKDWTGSVEGQNAIADWARRSNDVLAQAGRTIESVFTTLSKLSSSDALISFMKTVEDAFDYLGKLPLEDIVAKLVELAEVFRPISGPMLAIITAGTALNIMLGNLMGQIGGVVAIAVSFPGKFTGILSALRGGVSGGQMFLGIFSKIAGLLASGLKFAGIAGVVIWIGTLIAKSDELKAKLANVWESVQGVFSALGGAFSQVAQSLEPVVVALQPFFDLLSKIASLAIGVVLDWIASGIQAIANVITGVGGIISGFIDMLVGLFTWDPTTMLQGWNTFVSGLGSLIQGAWTLFIEFFAPAKFLKLAGTALGGLMSGIRGATGGIGSAAKGVFDSVIKWISQLPGKLLNLGKTALTNLRNAISNAVGSVRSAAGNVFNAVINAIKALPGKLLDFGRTALSNLSGAISGGVGAVKGAAGRVFNGVVDGIKNLPSKLLDFGRTALSKFTGAISDGVGRARGVAQNVASAVTGAVSDLPGKMLNIGKKVIGNVVDGIRGGIGRVKDAASAVAQAIRNFFPGSPVNEGPLTAWNTGGSAEGGGRNIVEAITGGLSNIRPIRKAMSDVADAVRSSMTPTFGSQGRVGTNTAAVAGGSSLTIGTLNLNVDVEDFESVPRIVNTLEGLAMKVRQGVRTGG